MARALGKLPAVDDPRMPTLRGVLKPAMLPRRTWVNWRADMPDDGIPMLGNDQAGCCVFATVLHYLQLVSLYTGVPLPSAPTADECLAAYTAVTGYNPADPATDKGTVVMGAGGMVEYWTDTGIVCGGKRNKLTSMVTVDFADPQNFKDALAIGPVFVGANLTQDDIDSSFMWHSHSGPIKGGHEFLALGFEELPSGKTYYDVETWDGLFRFTDDWLPRAVDEATVPLDAAFFGATGLDPAALDLAAVEAAIGALRRA